MPDTGLVDFGLGPYVHGTPSRRFPVYTRGNAGEVYPQAVFPLSTTMARDLGGDPFGEAMLSTGILTSAECAEDADVHMGVFGGYSYLNLSVSRVIATRTPGATIADSDATFLGAEGVAPPHVPQPGDVNRSATLRGVAYSLRVLLARSLPALEAAEAEAASWRASLPQPETATDDELAGVMTESSPVLSSIFTTHLKVTGGAGLGLHVLRDICRRKLGDEERALDLVAGVGEVASAEPAYALWDLGRMVASSPDLVALFDTGSAELLEAPAGVPAVDAFRSAFEEFLEAHGSRGPNEWEMACDVWATDPAMPLALVDRMRTAGDDHDPRSRSAVIAARREAAVADARSALGGATAWLFERALGSTVLHTRGREACKTLLVELVHEVRTAARELGGRLAERTPGGRADDLWYVTYSEFDDYRRDPGAYAEVVASRRATRAALSELVPPFAFTGEMPPVHTWERRRGVPASPAAPGTSLTGIAGCPGRAVGRARVVTDPSLPGDLGPGDVLVAPLTDPSWTPLFVPVEAVVVDVGGQMSHAVIVSRELGLPCVVSVAGATLSIPDGALVEVDGSAGTVTLLGVGGVSTHPAG